MKDRLKNIILLLICLSTSKMTFGQRERTVNWYFGNKAGLKFSPTLQSDTLGSQYTTEGCSTISDSCGNLLFYTDGMTVYSKNHSVMANGTGIDGDPSSTQCALIVPKPLNDSIYYIFTTGSSSNLYSYSTVNIKLNFGLGLVTSKNNTICTSNFSEKQAAIKHCNNQDVWVVSKNSTANNIYYSFLVTSSGLSLTPVTSTVSFNPSSDGIGYLKFSPDGNFLASAHSLIDSISVFKFNICTGKINSFMEFPTDTAVYGISFSDNSTKLYIANTLSSNQQSFLWQYDLVSNTPSTILASKILIKQLPNFTYFGALQLGPDDKIYITKYNMVTGFNYLGRISNPNISGLSCNYIDSAISIAPRITTVGLPNLIESYFNSNYVCLNNVGFKQNNLQNNFTLFPNPFSTKTNIEFSNKTIKQIELYNIYGFLTKRLSNINSNRIEIEKGNLESGIYFLQIKTDNNTTQTCRLIIE